MFIFRKGGLTKDTPVDLVLSCVDNFEARMAINTVSIAREICDVHLCLVTKGADTGSDCVLCSKAALCLDKAYLTMGAYVKCFVLMTF